MKLDRVKLCILIPDCLRYKVVNTMKATTYWVRVTGFQRFIALIDFDCIYDIVNMDICILNITY